MNRRSLLKAAAAAGVTGALAGSARGAAPGELQWEYDGVYSVLSGLTILDETLYVADTRRVHAVDVTDGTTKWVFENSGGASTPRVFDGTVYFAGSESAVAVDAADGSERWRRSLSGSQSRSLLPAGDTLLLRNESAMVGLDRSDGSERWRNEVNEPTVPILLHGAAYYSTDGGQVHAVDPRTGSRNRAFGFDVTDEYYDDYDPYMSAPTHDGESLYLEAGGGMHSLDPKTGEVEWRYELELGEGGTSVPTVANGTVYLAGGELLALDADTGTVQWKTDPMEGDGVVGAPTIAGDTVFFSRGNHWLHAHDATDGSKRWEYWMGGVPHSPIVVDGTVYVGNADNTVYAIDAGVDGSSEGSRVRLGTKGHIKPLDASTGSGSCPSLDTTTFELTEYPVQTGDRPSVSAVVEGATDVSLRATRTDDSGERVTAERSMSVVDEDVAGGKRWETDAPLPAIETEGTWVDLTIEVENDACRLQIDEFENSYIMESVELGYYVVEETMTGLVVVGQFPDEVVGTSGFEEWKQARQFDTNRIWASDRGSMGAVGVDLSFAWAGDEPYEVETPRSDYSSLRPPVIAQRKQFLNELKEAADDVSVDDYDFWIGTHAGEPVDSDAKDAMFYGGGRIYAAYHMQSDREHPVWPHEIGHAYGMAHTYDRGLSNTLGVMSRGARAGYGVPNPAPFSTPLRIAKTLRLVTAWHNQKSDHLQDWLSPQTTSIEGDLGGYERDIPALQSFEHGDEVPILKKPRTGRPNVWWVMESRPYLKPNVYQPPDDDELSREIEWSEDRGGAAVVYRRKVPGTGKGHISVPDHRGDGESWGVLEEVGDLVTDKIGLINPGKITFELEAIDGKQGPPEEFSTTISARRGAGDANTKTVSVESSIAVPTEVTSDGTGSPGDEIPLPSLRLRARDEEGNVVGVDDGQYVTEIPGATASGPRRGGLEWITVPADADVSFEVSAADAERYVEELEAAGVVDSGTETTDDPASADRLTSEELHEKLTLEYELSETRRGPNPTVTTVGDEPWVEDATVRVDAGSVDPGERVAAEPKNDDSPLEVVAIEHDDDRSSESIVFENRNGDALDVGGWTIENADGASMTVPDQTTIPAGDRLTVRSRDGTDTATTIYWGASDAVWSEDGGEVTVTDAEGTIRLEAYYDERGVLYYERPTRETAAGLPLPTAGLGVVGLAILYLLYRIGIGGDPDEVATAEE